MKENRKEVEEERLEEIAGGKAVSDLVYRGEKERQVRNLLYTENDSSKVTLLNQTETQEHTILSRTRKKEPGSC